MYLRSDGYLQLQLSQIMQQIKKRRKRTTERNINCCHLDVLNSAACRVKSQQGTQYHIGGTQRLKKLTNSPTSQLKNL